MRKNDYIRVKKRGYRDFLMPNFLGGSDYNLCDDVLSPSTGANCYNFDFSDGNLKEGYGIDECFYEKQAITSMWLYRRYNHETGENEKIFMFSDIYGQVCYYKDRTGSPKQFEYLTLGILVAAPPTAVNYRLNGEDVIIMCTENDYMWVWDGKNQPTRCYYSPLITSLDFHGERLFVTISGQKDAIWFSDDLDPTNWNVDLSEAGFIQLIDERGSLNKVVSYLNYLYVFRDYGISRLYATGDQSEFSVSNLFVSSGKIYADTVCLCGDRILFLSDDGLYSFDGLSASKIASKLSGLFRGQQKPTAAYVSGKYYLSFRGAVKDENRYDEVEYDDNNNYLLVYDINSGQYSLSRGFDIRRICAVDGKPFVVMERSGIKYCGVIAKNGAVLGDPLFKKWTIPKTDFSMPDKVKRIKYVYIYTKYDIRLCIRTDTEEKTIIVYGSGKPQRVFVGMHGVRIGMDIISQDVQYADISRPMLRISV